MCMVMSCRPPARPAGSAHYIRSDRGVLDRQLTHCMHAHGMRATPFRKQHRWPAAATANSMKASEQMMCCSRLYTGAESPDTWGSSGLHRFLEIIEVTGEVDVEVEVPPSGSKPLRKPLEYL